MQNSSWTILLVIGLAAFVGSARADPRIREVAFDPKSVVTVGTKPGVATMVEFGPNEHVLSVGTGQGADCAQAADPWCVAWPAGSSFLYVRPRTRASSSLTLAVVTDRHAYSLQFDPMAPGDARPATYRLIFTYPAPVAATAQADSNASGEARAPVPVVPVVPESQIVEERLKSAPIPVNSNYTIAYGKASEELRPSIVFDDGRFTYIRWAGNREIPAVFEIRPDGSEMVVNTRMEGDLVVLDRVARALMLRSGAAVASLRNESFDSEGIGPVGGTTVPGVERRLVDGQRRSH
ncbi:MAG TPA: TrbG/VirB9 family P-type conjugative transfer protein [Burkholderiaceae bacterium]|nr:TrbG/VirB9 family P-type conjugative transfer protein [Burkholderiaceae bacterium]